MTRSALAAFFVLFLTLPAHAEKVRLQVTSEPTGATIEFNGEVIGTSPHAADLDDWMFKSPKWLWSKFLGEEIVLRVWKEGYFPKEVRITSGPHVWVNPYGSKVYHVITATQFHVRLEPHTVAPSASVPTPTTSDSTPTEPTVSTGSAFLVAKSGYLVTNYHVVEGADRIAIRFPASDYIREASVALRDQPNDLVVLQLKDFDPKRLPVGPIPFTFPPSGSARMGQNTYTIGFPLADVMGDTPRLSSGLVNALYGVADDPRLIQISNPTQPGNSGGPLINENGELVGVVVSGLSAKYFYENAGIVPQNVNFAVKAAYLRSLLELLPSGTDVMSATGSALKGLSLEQQAERVTPFVAQVVAIQMPSQQSRAPTPTSRPLTPMPAPKPAPSPTVDSSAFQVRVEPDGNGWRVRSASPGVWTQCRVTIGASWANIGELRPQSSTIVTRENLSPPLGSTVGATMLVTCESGGKPFAATAGL